MKYHSNNRDLAAGTLIMGLTWLVTTTLGGIGANAASAAGPFLPPTAAPLVYELDSAMKPQKSYYLGDQEEIRRKMEAVANQGKAKS